ncbi:MAG: TrmH family RNA methyltransferase [Salibacteraceae bacterium]
MSVKTIESFSNPQYKFLKSLSKSRNRRKEERFLMEGRPELDVAFQQGLKPELIAYCDFYISEVELAKLISNSDFQLLHLKKELFESITYQHVRGNFLAVFSSFYHRLDDIDVDGDLLILEKVEKPGNLGAILRTADALGYKTVICTETEIDLFNPNVLRNSRGALFGLKTVFASNEQTLEFLEKNNFKIYAAALTDQAEDYRMIRDINEKLALIFGSESKGLSDFWLYCAHQHVIIPMHGVVDSLNLSVTLAILACYRKG